MATVPLAGWMPARHMGRARSSQELLHDSKMWDFQLGMPEKQHFVSPWLVLSERVKYMFCLINYFSSKNDRFFETKRCIFFHFEPGLIGLYDKHTKLSRNVIGSQNWPMGENHLLSMLNTAVKLHNTIELVLSENFSRPGHLLKRQIIEGIGNDSCFWRNNEGVCT